MSSKIDLQTIRIEKVIVHDLPKHKKDDETTAPSYSAQESKLSTGLKLFFKDKAVQALISDKSLKVVYDPDKDSPVSMLVSDMLKTKCADIVKSSQAIGKQLFDVQVGNNASGILVVIYGKLNDKSICMLLKLERDQGAQLRLDPITKSYDIQEVKDLMLTQKTKIFKVALFFTRKEFSVKFDGMVMDYQINIKAKKEIVTFFIDKFLGCKPFQDPKVTTQKFYNLTRAFVGTIDDDIQKAKYLQDLNSYIQKNSHTINPMEFADDYLKTAEKNKYKEFMEEKNFPFSETLKDIQLIENKVKKFVVQFENDVSIISNKGSFDSKVKMEKLHNGQTRAVVTSRIKKVE